ncbi:hypothetical protein Tco_0717459, partial [Tanacetum coccineum]
MSSMFLLIVPVKKVLIYKNVPVNYVPINDVYNNLFTHMDDSHEFQPTPNGTPYWVPDVPEDEKPKEGLLFDSYNDAYETYLVYSQKA